MLAMTPPTLCEPYIGWDVCLHITYVFMYVISKVIAELCQDHDSQWQRVIKSSGITFSQKSSSESCSTENGNSSGQIDLHHWDDTSGHHNCNVHWPCV